MRWSEEEFALFMQHLGVNRAQTQPVSEKVWQATVLRLPRVRVAIVSHV